MKPATKKYFIVVEGARGFAAFYILFHHIIFLANADNFFSKNSVGRLVYDISASFTTHALMLFFLLSGFAIHYANAGRIKNFSTKPIKTYFYKRIRRIYPIYVLAIVMSLAAIAILHHLGEGNNWPAPTIHQLVGALFFFSDLPSRDGTWIPTLSTNGPLWSLSYEVLYYLLYPLFSILTHKCGFKVALCFAGLLSLGAVVFATGIHPTQITNMISLYILWCLGAYLAEIELQSKPFNIHGILAVLALTTWAQSLWIFQDFLMWRVPLSFQLYTGLFIFSLMVCYSCKIARVAWGRSERYCGAIFILATAAAVIFFAIKFETTKNQSFLVVRVIAVMTFGLLWLLTTPNSLFSWIRKFGEYWETTGSYSYGLYILQFPILIICFVGAHVFFQNALWGILGAIPSVWLAAIVEKQIQPLAAQHMDNLMISERATSLNN